MKSSLKFGLITGVISIIWLFGSFTLFTWLNSKYGWGIQASTIRGIGGLISIPIQGIGIYLAMQNVKQLTGSLSYTQGIKTGLTVAVTIAVIVAVFSFLYCRFLNPGYADFMISDAQKAMIAKGAMQQQIAIESAEIGKQFTTGAQVTMALVGQFVTGAIITLVLGLFIKTKRSV